MPKDTLPPAFLFYPDDFCSDGKVEAMTTEEVGAYILLLCKAWREEPVGSIPDNDPVLARWTRLGPERWPECKPAVLAPFRLGKDSRWHQPRLRSEYEKLLRVRAAKSAAGRKGANLRYGKDLDSSAMADPLGVLKQSHSISIPIPIPSSIPNPRKGTGGKPPKPRDGTDPDLDAMHGLPPIPPKLDTPKFRTAWQEWVQHCAQRNGHPITPLSARKLLQRMADEMDASRAVIAIDYSIGNNYAGVVEPRDSKQDRPDKRASQRMTSNVIVD